MKFLQLTFIFICLAMTDAQDVQKHPCANRYNVSCFLKVRVHLRSFCLQVFAADPFDGKKFYWCSGSAGIVSYCPHDRRFVESVQYCMPINPPSTTTSSSLTPETSIGLPTTTRRNRPAPSRIPRTTRVTSTSRGAAPLNVPITRPPPTRRVPVRS